MNVSTPWTSRAAVAATVSLIAPGPARERYRAELLAELADLDTAARIRRAASLVRGAPALHRALVETGAVAFPHAPWWCRARLHHSWTTASTADGGRFRYCRACGVDDDETLLGEMPVTSYAVAPDGSA